MRLQKLRGSGYKRNDFETELTGLDFFSGHNGSGKSSRLECATILALGGQPGEILKFSPTGRVRIEGDFGETTATRIFQATGTSKREAYLGDDNQGYEKGNKAISELLGMSSMMMYPGEFAKLSDTKKQEFVVSFSPEGINWKKEDVQFFLECNLLAENKGVLDVVLQMVCDGLTTPAELNLIAEEKRPAVVGVLMGFAKKEQGGNVGSVDSVNSISEKIQKKWNDNLDFSQNLDYFLSYFKLEKNVCIKKIKEQEATVKTVKENAVKGETTAGSISETEQEIVVLRKKLTTVEKETTANNHILKAVINREKREGAIVTEIKILCKIKNMDKEKIRHIESDINCLSVHICNDVEVAERLKQYRDRENILKLMAEKGRDHILQLEAEKKTQETIKRNLKVRNGERCVVDTRIKCETDMLWLGMELERGVNTLCSQIEKMKNDLEIIFKDQKGNNLKIKTTENEIKNNEKRERDISILKVKLSASNDNITVSLQNIKTYENELTRLAEEAKSEKVVSNEILIAQKNNLESQISEKETTLEKLQAEKTREVTALQVKIQLANNKAELVALKKTIELLGKKGLQGEVMRKVKAPLEAEVNETLQAIDPDMTFKIELQDGFRMGWHKDGNLIETANQAHQVMLSVAFLTAVINRLKPGWRLMCVEAAELRNDNLLRLLKGLSKIHEAGKLDNILVAHHYTFFDGKNPVSKVAGFVQHALLPGEER